MPLYTDQTRREIQITATPLRIVSTVPSQTELLFELGLNEKVTGITKFCIHPAEWFRSKTRIGGTKQLKTDIIYELQPDLIIANKEENTKEQIEELSKLYPVWISDVNTLQDAYAMIEQIGIITGTKEKAIKLIDTIQKQFATLKPLITPIRTAYLIWKDPHMTIGNDTFIHDMLKVAGFENVFADNKRYPTLSIEELQQKQCEVLFLSTEPFPFGSKHVEELQPLLPQTKIMVVNGELFSWYGSRLLHTPAYLQELINQISH